MHKAQFRVQSKTFWLPDRVTGDLVPDCPFVLIRVCLRLIKHPKTFMQALLMPAKEFRLQIILSLIIRMMD